MSGQPEVNGAVAPTKRAAARAGTMRRFSATLRRLMASRGVTQASLARAIPEVSQQALSDYLAEQKLPMADAVIALASYFRVTTDHLLGRRPPRGGRR